jgi:hypothetical protein
MNKILTLKNDSGSLLKGTTQVTSPGCYKVRGSGNSHGERRYSPSYEFPDFLAIIIL